MLLIRIQEWSGRKTERNIQETESPHVQQQFIAAAVWLHEHADSTQLRALGTQLQQWASSRDDIAGIHGLDSLLSGIYPDPFGSFELTDTPEDGAIPFRFPHFAEKNGEVVCVARFIARPWKHCPAVVLATSDTSGDEIMRSLKSTIPPALGTVGFDFFLP